MKRYFALLVLFGYAALAQAASLPDFSALVAENGPAVVNISTTQTIKPENLPNLPQGTPFDDLFRRYFDHGQPEFDTKSLGSGFIISSDGYILTSAHVVENAKEVVVKLTDRREFVAKTIGADKRSDVALLKINATGLPTVNIGDPSKLKVGEWVLAIGSPFGFENSATAGIVSATQRSLPTEPYVPFIQTDVAINPGNSGGPLFNLKGQVIGINSQIYSRTGGFMGLSFSVPIDMAMYIAKQLRTSSHVKRGWLGITIQDVTRELAQSFHMQKPSGALVSDILPHSPAAKSDLRVGDVVVDYQGHPIDLSSELPPLVGMTTPGTKVELGIVRKGKHERIPMTVGELPETRQAQGSEEGPMPGNRTMLGLAISDLTPVQRRKLGVDYGVLVNEIASGPALRAGIRPGDAILELDGKPVKNVATFELLVKRLPKHRPVPVLIRRGNGSLFLALQLS